MGAIRELDHDDANVAHHGQQHFAKAFHMRFFAAVELNLIELGNAIYEVGDFRAEALGDFGFGGRGVFDDIVKDGRGDGLRVHMQIRKQVCHRHGVSNIRLAAAAPLAVMSLCAKLISFPDALDLIGRQVGLELIEELSDSYGPSSTWQ